MPKKLVLFCLLHPTLVYRCFLPKQLRHKQRDESQEECSSVRTRFSGSFRNEVKSFIIIRLLKNVGPISDCSVLINYLKVDFNDSARTGCTVL